MHLTLHLTARCNMRCRYCYAAPHAGGDMTFDTARRAIDLACGLACANGQAGSLGVIFFGGEPLLKRDLIREIIAYCNGLREQTGRLFHYKITTNGLLLDEDFLTDPLTAEVFVALSHDGVPDAHDFHRLDMSGAGTFETLQPVARMLLQHKPYSPVMLVVTPETVTHFAASVRFLFGCGFRYLICSLNYGTDWKIADFSELEKQYRRIAEWYEEQTIREEKFYFSPFDVKIASHVFPGSCLRERCELGQRQISIAPTGRIFPCVQFVGDGGDSSFCIGDVANGIREERRDALYKENAAEREPCISCAIRERCNHFCGCLNRQSTGSIRKVSPVLCAHERIVLPIADRLAEKLFKKRNEMFIQKQYNELFPLISLAEDRSREMVST